MDPIESYNLRAGGTVTPDRTREGARRFASAAPRWRCSSPGTNRGRARRCSSGRMAGATRTATCCRWPRRRGGSGGSVLLDLPGFGASPPPPDAWGTEDYADAVAEFLAARPAGRLIWIGHSFGCRVGLQLAARHPGLVDGLFLIAAAGLPRTRSPLGARPDRGTALAFRLARRFTPEGPRRDALRARFGSADYARAGPMRPILVKTVGEDLSEAARAVRCPTRAAVRRPRRRDPARDRRQAEQTDAAIAADRSARVRPLERSDRRTPPDRAAPVGVRGASRVTALPVLFAVLGFAVFAARRLLTYLHLFQQEEYDIRRFLRWIGENRGWDRRLSLILLAIFAAQLILLALVPEAVFVALGRAGLHRRRGDRARSAQNGEKEAGDDGARQADLRDRLGSGRAARDCRGAGQRTGRRLDRRGAARSVDADRGQSAARPGRGAGAAPLLERSPRQARPAQADRGRRLPVRTARPRSSTSSGMCSKPRRRP